MAIWAIADLHLSFGVPDKSMDLFGPQWFNHPEKVKANWLTLISPDDLVLIPGDISWAMTPENAKADLDWIDALPGTKVMIRGNHDYWWTSLSKVEKVLPPSIHLIQNNAFRWKNVAIAGARLWDTPEYNFKEWVEYRDNPKQREMSKDETHSKEDDEKIFRRELLRLETSLKALDRQADIRIAMTHYPPIGSPLADSQTSQLLDKYGINVCVFGHLHNLKPNVQLFGTKNRTLYALTACDYLNFIPLKISD